MSKVVIAYFSFTGKTKTLAEAAADGAKKAGAEVVLKEAAGISAADVAGADVFVVATPQTFGTMAGETKKLFERLWMQKDQIGKAGTFAGIICHASEPAATLNMMEQLAGYFGFSEVKKTLTIPVAELETGQDRCRELGATLAS